MKTDNSAYELLTDQSLGTYYYRVMQMDLNGNKTYSPARKVVMTETANMAGSWVTENPGGGIDFHIFGQSDEAATVSVINMSGQIMASKSMQLHSGMNTVSFSGIMKGMYIIATQNNSGTDYTKCVLDY
jgi:hypothetical protein